MPIIKEMSNLEKITLMYKGSSSILERTNFNSQPSSLRNALCVNTYYKYRKQRDNKFRSNAHLFCVKFNSSLPENPLSMRTVYLERQSQMTPFHPRKVSRKDLECILKWGIFYNQKNKHFTVPCGGALYHYEIYVCLFQSYLLPLGLYRYNPQNYTLGLIKKGNFMEETVNVLNAYFDRLRSSSGVIFITSNLSESRQKYDFRSERLILLDIGHLMYSLNLSCTAFDYGVSNIGSGLDKMVVKFLGETSRSNYIASLFFGGKEE